MKSLRLPLAFGLISLSTVVFAHSHARKSFDKLKASLCTSRFA
ncbi:MAG: hypothetical protein ABSB60_16475 [Terracidiphilus sp.]|jgi:hypothetical protein